jgi:hypothetical protein
MRCLCCDLGFPLEKHQGVWYHRTAHDELTQCETRATDKEILEDLRDQLANGDC